MKKETITSPKKKAIAERSWRIYDAKDRVLGRIATEIASTLRGKNKPSFTPHIDCGDFVIVVNARYVVLTGKKRDDKQYYRHTEYPGGIRNVSAAELFETAPENVLKNAVVGMLPKNSLGRQLAKKLKIYPEADHPHGAQKPIAGS